MGTYRSRDPLTGPLTPERVVAVALPRTGLGRHGYRIDDVDALLHRLAYELRERSRQLDLVRDENQRIKHALRSWQADHATRRRAF